MSGLNYNMKKVERTNYKKFSDFEVGDMMNENPMKYIKFYHCHRLQISFYDFWGYPMARSIDKQSTPRKSGLINYFDFRNYKTIFSKSYQLQEGLNSSKSAIYSFRV